MLLLDYYHQIHQLFCLFIVLYCRQRVQGQDQRIVTLHSDNSQLKIDLQRHKQVSTPDRLVVLLHSLEQMKLN